MNADCIENEVDDGKSEDGDNEADNSIKNSVFCISDFFAVAAREDVTQAAPDKHDNRNDTYDIEDGVGDLSEDSVYANEFGRHTISACGFGSVLNTESHSFASAKRSSGANTGNDL